MSEERRMSMILFSGDMDKAMAALVLATGAASMGYQVTVFLHFFGV